MDKWDDYLQAKFDVGVAEEWMDQFKKEGHTLSIPASSVLLRLEDGDKKVPSALASAVLHLLAEDTSILDRALGYLKKKETECLLASEVEANQRLAQITNYKKQLKVLAESRTDPLL